MTRVTRCLAAPALVHAGRCTCLGARDGSPPQYPAARLPERPTHRPTRATVRTR